MRTALSIIALLAAGSAALGGIDLLATVRPGATVFQQISARLDVGLSLIVLVTCLGFLSVLGRMDEHLAAQRRAAAAAPTDSSGSRDLGSRPLSSLKRSGD